MKLSIIHLRAAGLGAEQILRIIEEAQAEQREKWRIKSRNQRARIRDIGDRGETRDGHIDTSSLRTENKKQVRKKVSIPENWKLTAADRDYAKSKGWNDERIEREAERFRVHYLANGETRKSWPASWQKWVISPYQSRGYGNGNHGRRHGSLLDVIDKVIEHTGGEDTGYVPGSEGPRPLELDKPARKAGVRLISKGRLR